MEVCKIFLQNNVKDHMKEYSTVNRVMPAPMAVAGNDSGLDFAKFSTVGPLLDLITDGNNLKQNNIRVVANCIVEKILHRNGIATALKTSRGIVSIGDAKLILACACLPATTLVLNSFDYKNWNGQKPGSKYSAHFISPVVARVPRKCYKIKLNELELSAIYVGGVKKKNRQQT